MSAALPAASADAPQIRIADHFAGADAGEKIAAAIADLPAAGGFVDARTLTADQYSAATIVIDKPVRLLLGDTRLISAASPAIRITASEVLIEGTASPATPATSVTSVRGGADAITVDASQRCLQTVVLRNLQLDTTTRDTGGGIRVLASARPVVDLLLENISGGGRYPITFVTGRDDGGIRHLALNNVRAGKPDPPAEPLPACTDACLPSAPVSAEEDPSPAPRPAPSPIPASGVQSTGPLQIVTFFWGNYRVGDDGSRLRIHDLIWATASDGSSVALDFCNPIPRLDPAFKVDILYEAGDECVYFLGYRRSAKLTK